MIPAWRGWDGFYTLIFTLYFYTHSIDMAFTVENNSKGLGFKLCGSPRLLLKWKRQNEAVFEGSDVLGVSVLCCSAPGPEGSQPELSVQP